MIPRALILAVLFLTANNAQARLGETVDQLTARYGQGTNAGKNVLVFHKQNWTITVRFIDGVSASEQYQKGGGPSNDDINTLLSINAEGQTWRIKTVQHTLGELLVPTLATTGRCWERDDGALAYTPGGLQYCLTVKSKALVDAEAAQKAADEKAKQSSLNGF